MTRALRALPPCYFRFLQEVLLLRARDLSPLLQRGPLLVLAPHPDDETLGCGGAIARARARGVEVHVVVVCDGRHSHRSERLTPAELARLRREEVIEACRRLGVEPDHVLTLGHEDRRVLCEAPRLADELGDIVARLGPALVLAPCGVDKHPDHRAIHAVVRRLVEHGRITCPVYEYPVWYWTPGTWTTPGSGPLARAAQILGRTARAALGSRPYGLPLRPYSRHKRHALEAFESQMRNITGEPGWPTLSPAFLAAFFRRAELFFPLGQAGAPPLSQPREDPWAIHSGGLAWGWPDEAAR